MMRACGPSVGEGRAASPCRARRTPQPGCDELGSSQAANAANGREGSRPSDCAVQAKSSRVELDQRRDHLVEGQDALGSRCRAKQTFARAARWLAASHQAA